MLEVRVLLTGGAGFIGSHVADHSSPAATRSWWWITSSAAERENVPDGVHLVDEDIRSGCEAIFRRSRPEVLMPPCRPDRCPPLGARAGYDAEINIAGTIRLLQNCLKYGTRRVLFASSGGAVYGEQAMFPASEDHPQLPISPYGVSKLAVERYLHFYHVQYGISYAALRYANVYGPRQDPHGEAGVVAIFCDNLILAETSTINGTGEQTRDYVYVGDVARANVLALEGDPLSGAYNIGTGVETDVNELYDVSASPAGCRVNRQARAAKQANNCAAPSIPLSATLLGWRSQVN